MITIIKQFFLHGVGKRFFNSEYDKVHFKDSLSSFILSVIGFVFWLAILFLFSFLIYARINYPEKFKQLYDVPNRDQKRSQNTNWFNNNTYQVRNFIG